MTQRGFPGEEGQPGKPGEEGKDSGEGGRGGEGGEGGIGGAGAPQGPGGGGGEGGPGGQGARGATGPRGAPGPSGADGVQPKLRWMPAVGYVLLALVLGFLIFRVQTTCVDTRGNMAVRSQWTRVAALIDAQDGGKVTPAVAAVVPRAKVGDKLTPEIARDAFVASYRLAIREAGPAPDCRGLAP
jgi:hypothetical protein